jgi:hypothetical protein
MKRHQSLLGPLPALAALALAIPAFGSAPRDTPRSAPEFTISEISGKTTLLSSYKGRVVAMEFLFVQSDHCVRVARMLDKLNRELGPSGFQAVGIAFDPPNAPNSGALLIPALIDYLKLSYPMGYATKADVDRFLGRGERDVLNIPQVVVTDGTGRIRAMTGGVGGDPKLEDEASLRGLIQTLISEKPPGENGR